MSDKKLIAVVGATGAQGGGLVRAILDDPSSEFRVRAITRDPSSAKAKALGDRGAEVVAANVGDLESLKAAFQGAYGVFGVTFFWDHFSPDQEKQEARNIADAAKAAGAQHVIWSTLEDTRHWMSLDDDRMPTLMEHYKVPHFDAKGESDAYFTQIGLPTTFLLTSFYWDNFIHFGMGPQAGPDGGLGIAFPMGEAPLPGIAAEDIGRSAYGIFQRPELIGQTVGIAGEHLTGAQMAEGFTRVIGKPVTYHAVSPEAYRSFGFPGADDLGNMFQFKRDFNADFCAPRDVARTRQLNPKLQTFDQWLDANASHFSG